MSFMVTNRPSTDWVIVGAGPSGHGLTLDEVTTPAGAARQLMAIDSAVWDLQWPLLTHWLCPQPGEFERAAIERFGTEWPDHLFQQLASFGARIIVWRLPDGPPLPWYNSIDWLVPVLATPGMLAVGREPPDDVRWEGPPRYVACELGDEVRIGKDVLHGWAPGFYVLPWWDPCGPLGVQYAVNHGATTIDVYGFEGRDFKTRAGAARHDGTPSYVIQQRILQCIVTASPQTQFRFHGELLYTLAGDNVTTATANKEPLNA